LVFSKRAVRIADLSNTTEQAIDNQDLIGIFDQFYQPVYRFIFRHLGDQETSKELSSEVFKRLVVTCQKKNMVKAQVSPWLYRTAQNLLIDLNEEVAEKSMLPPEIVDQKISETYIRKALKTLTPEQRTVIVLKYLEGKSNQEVAEIMHKSVGAIKSLQNRALNALRRMLSEVMEG